MDRPVGSSVAGPAFVCSVKRCDEIATIVVEHHNRAERPLCAEHWDLARSMTDAVIGVVCVLPRPALRNYLNDWRDERRLLGQSTRLLFVSPDGRPLHPDTITSLFHRHSQEAGLPKSGSMTFGTPTRPLH